MSLHLEIVTPEKKVFSDTVENVVLPGAEGELGILDGHAALVTSLAAGELRYRKGGAETHLALGTGFAFPSRTVYFGRDPGVDVARGELAEAEVRQWRAENRLPFPEFDYAERVEMSDTLAFPPEGPPSGFPRPSCSSPPPRRPGKTSATGARACSAPVLPPRA